MTVQVTVHREGPGEFSWGVYVNGMEIYGGLSRDEARRRRWRIWWALPEQRAAARDRITGG